MAGINIGLYGFQRSGKSMLAYILAEKQRQRGCKVYTNMYTRDFIKIDSLTDIPFNLEPKVLLLDEAYYFLDSRDFKDNTKSTIFWNTIGKLNILLLTTAISPDMIEKRIRNQHNYVIISKKEGDIINYLIIDRIRMIKRTFRIKTSEKLFKKLNYDHQQVPDIIDITLDGFLEKTRDLNKKLYFEGSNYNGKKARQILKG